MVLLILIVLRAFEAIGWSAKIVGASFSAPPTIPEQYRWFEMASFIGDAGSSVLNSGSGVVGSGLDLATAIVGLINSIFGAFA
ncbi:hypothetical protein [Nocardia sp. IFM 10818]